MFVSTFTKVMHPFADREVGRFRIVALPSVSSVIACVQIILQTWPNLLEASEGKLIVSVARTPAGVRYRFWSSALDWNDTICPLVGVAD